MIPRRICRARSDGKIRAGMWRHSIRCHHQRDGGCGQIRSRFAVSSGGSKDLVEHAEKATNLERLGQIITGAGCEHTLDLARCGVGADHDDWDFGGLRLRLQLLEYSAAVNVGKV